MFRVGLIAYLSLATAFAPFLCCCSAPRLTALLGNRQHFSNTATEQVLAEGGKLARKRFVGPASCCQRQSSDLGSLKPAGSPCRDNDGSSCPCGKRQATVAAANANDVLAKIVEVNNPLWDLPLANLSSDRDFDITVLSASFHEKPAGIYGRELLRAFQIMRC
jgi:hypothetical protein